MEYKWKDIINADWIGIIAILLIVISGCFFTYYLIINEINSCTADPLDYAILKEINENYTYAKLNIYYNKEDLVPIKTIEKNLKPNLRQLPNLSSQYK